MSSSRSDSLPDASGLVIAARGLPDYAASTDGGGAAAHRRDRHSSYYSGSDVPVVGPHDYDQARERRSSSLGRALRRRKPHESVGFWDPALSRTRRTVMIQWAATVLFLVCAVMAVLALYWADLFVVDKKLRNLVVHVVDFDGQVAPYQDVAPLVGPTMVQAAQAMVDSDSPSLGYVAVPPSLYGFDPAAARQAVYNWDCYAAVIVNANATALLRAAVAGGGNASYDPAGAVQLVLLTARQESSYYNYVIPQLEALSRRFAASFGPRWSRELASNGSYSRAAMARAPAAVNPGVAPLQIDLRPFQPVVATPAVTVGLIYLIIMAFFSYSFFLPIHMKYIQPKGHPPLHFWQFVIWRLCATVMAYLFISLAYSLVSLAFQIPFWPGPASQTEVAFNATAYGRGSFPVYWMVNFVGMNALGIACENVANIVGQPWTALWLIFWVITNVATAFYDVALAPGFFRWGYAWPLFHVVMASRQILFDLHSRIGLNFGVLFAWVAVNIALFPFCCYFTRWKTERARRKSADETGGDTYTVKTASNQVEIPKEKGAKPPKRKRGFMRGI